MTALSNSVVISKGPAISLSSGSSLKSAAKRVGPTSLAFGSKGARRSCARNRPLTITASYSDGGRPSNASIFFGGFVLGGLIGGALGSVYAPQISKALTGPGKKELMKKLPKFMYDEEKVLEKRGKKLSEKIEQLKAAIDLVSNQLKSERSRNGAAASSDDDEALI